MIPAGGTGNDAPEATGRTGEASAEAAGPPAARGQTSAPASRRRQLAGVGPAILLVIIALWESAASLWGGGDVSRAADWQRASQWIRDGHHSGDLIVFAPTWIDPIGRLHLGDLISVEMAARMDGARYGVIWEVSARGARAPEVAGLAAERRVAFGELEVSRYVKEPAQVTTDFVAALADASVHGNAAQRPSVRLEEVGFAPHRCVLTVPRPDQTVTITYSQVELGTELVGYVGLGDVFTRRDIRDPGRLTVAIAGRQVAEVTAGVDDGWVRFSARTDPGPADVTLAATAVGKGAHKRRICFAAEARR